MSRYICVDDICIPSDENDWEELVAFADMVAEQEPIEIIRCGECKYWKSTVQMPNGTEVKCLYGRKPDDFCSYGMRSEKPNNCEDLQDWKDRMWAEAVVTEPQTEREGE